MRRRRQWRGVRRRRQRRIVTAVVCIFVVLVGVATRTTSTLHEMELERGGILELEVDAALDATGLSDYQGYQSKDVYPVASWGDVRVCAMLGDEDADEAREDITMALAAYSVATGATDVPTADEVIAALATSADKALLGTPTGGVTSFLFWCRQSPDLVYATDDARSGHRAGDTYVSYGSNYTWATSAYGWSGDEGLCYRREYEAR